ncbi:MAG: glucose-6-phosphate isomerase [Gemmatimonadota bacterium]|mgnify:CR=1 FL=1
MILQYGRMFQDRLDQEHGLPRGALEDLVRRFPEVQDEIRLRRLEGEYGFEGLVTQYDTVDGIRRFAEGVGQAFDHVLVLGIGGSALGTKALANALLLPAWNELDDERRDFFPKLTVLENVDPTTVAAALRRIDPRRALVNVVSKSGGTAETMAQYLVVRHWLETAVGTEAATGHFVFTTDPERGPLRQIANEEGIATLEIPPEVGGRFSVLSPVGLLPAALVGIDIEGLLRGARKALDRARTDDLLANPPGLYAGLHWAADTLLGARIHVMMPYTDRLREFSSWFVQLWAESLGKRLDRGGNVVHRGPTPLAAVGATDQHSQVQLFMEGPFDKVVTMVAVEPPGEDVLIPPRSGLPEEAAYLGTHTLGGLLRAEREATSSALARMGRMNATLTLRRLDAEAMGELLMFFQLAAGYAGVWYRGNPFDQPGVELGKRLTFGAMGRAGYEREAPAPEGDRIDAV